jgi:ethanolamine utilization protein EutN
MKLAKVIGTVVSTQKIDSVKDLKIMMIQPLNEKQEHSGGPIAAIDTVQAGTGDLVYYTLSREASLALPQPFAPVDAAITGIVDQVTVEDPGIPGKKNIFEKD